MNDSPGWASPGSAPSDGPDGSTRPVEPAEPVEPADENGSAASKWSSNQPPPGQWSAPGSPGSGPTPPPPPPGPGWGGSPRPGGWNNQGGWNNGGWQQGGWQPQPAAKPGIIPLRPLGVGEILDGAVTATRTHWRTVLGVTIGVAVVVQICDILVQRFLMPEPVTIDRDATGAEALDQTFDALQSSVISMIPVLLLSLIGTLFTTAVLTVVISRSVLGRPVTLSDAWREARPRLLPLLGLTLLLPLIASAVLLVGILPGSLTGGSSGVALTSIGVLAALGVVLWLMVSFSLASPALMLERQGIVTSLRRSAKLVKGSWWRTFGVLALTLLITFIITMVIDLLFMVIAILVGGTEISSLTASDADLSWPFLIITGIGAVIASAITYPISAGVTVLLYVDQRIRREALDLELGRAAGLPGYTDTSGS
ncbi:hypothetical protein [Streptomyces sp. NPDC050504]|uniref:DUF7544 domain-containing protein n=1 Tax=Streptomyces sp. NPDC050504 TaxID=3365618 RepID=UPI003793CEEC